MRSFWAALLCLRATVQQPYWLRMASLTLKNIPDDLLETLRTTAEREHRSLTQQVIHLLESAVRKPAPAAPQPRTEEAEARLAAWRKLAAEWPDDIDGAEIMDARTLGREVPEL